MSIEQLIYFYVDGFDHESLIQKNKKKKNFLFFLIKLIETHIIK